MQTRPALQSKIKSIYESSDHREFLRSYLETRKKTGGLRALARKAGFKSPGHLAMVVSGERKLTSRSAELLAQAFGFRGRQKSLMLAYAKLDSARSERERAVAREEVLRLKSASPQFEINQKQYAFLATWYYPVIFGLLHQREVSQDPAEISLRLGRGVNKAAVTKAIDDLAALGLIARGEDERWVTLNAALTTPEDVRSASVAQYHRNSIRLSEDALELPLERRELNGLTISVPDRLLPEVKEKIRRFRSELNELLANENEPADVYQLNLHLFPLTQMRKEGPLK